MAEGVSQEGFFWNTYPWVMSGNSSGGEERFSGDKNSLENHNQMKQHKMVDTLNGSSGRDQQEAETTIGGGSKKNDDTLEIKKEIKTEDDSEVSLHNRKAKRKVIPSDHELHILTERERRKKMRNMFQQLHALMPQLPQKVDKSTIVDEAIGYIQTLQQTLQRLETKKLERIYGASTKTTTGNTRESFLADQGSSTSTIGKVSPSSSTSLSLSSPKIFQTWVSSNVTLNVCGLDAHISICAPRKPGLLTAICFVLEKHKLEIVSADISSDELKNLFMIHVQANTCDQFMEAFHYDEIYKQAASEITQWVNP